MMTLSKEKLEEIHKKILYPVVRVRTEKAGGTGIIIYSKPTPDNPEEYETYVLTCHHVIEDAISFVKVWSSIAKREITVEDRKKVYVESFIYEKLSKCVGGTTYQADIVAWDKPSDIAVLKVNTSRKFDYIAKLYPRGKEDDIKLGHPLVACGCSLGHEPIFTFGNLVSKHDIIENKEYWMTTANVIFGNSGGGVFLQDTCEYVGMTARVSGIQLGFGLNIVTWMGFFVPMERIYKFFDDNFLMFLYDPKYTSKQCEEMRKKKEEEEEKKLIIPFEKNEGSKKYVREVEIK